MFKGESTVTELLILKLQHLLQTFAGDGYCQFSGGNNSGKLAALPFLPIVAYTCLLNAARSHNAERH
jgi:hypothetical protein